MTCAPATTDSQSAVRSLMFDLSAYVPSSPVVKYLFAPTCIDNAVHCPASLLCVLSAGDAFLASLSLAQKVTVGLHRLMTGEGKVCGCKDRGKRGA